MNPTTTTAPQRGVFASFAFLLVSMMLSVQALAFDVDGFSYTVITGTTNVVVTGPAPGNTDLIINIPATAVGGTTTYSVTTIGENFINTPLISVTIPDSVTSIGDNAFGGTGIFSVAIGNSVEIIGDNAFTRNLLTSVTIPDSVTSIGEGAFSDNGLTSVIIPDSVTSIGDAAFAGNGLTSVTIGNSVETIGDFAFGRNGLTSVIIPDSVTSIGAGAFSRNGFTSAAFLGNFGTFNLDMFRVSSNLATITYVQGAEGWNSPQRIFTPDTGQTGSVTATPAAAPAPAPVATPVPTSPLWLLGMMAGLLSLVAVRKLRKA